MARKVIKEQHLFVRDYAVRFCLSSAEVFNIREQIDNPLKRGGLFYLFVNYLEK